MKTFSTKRIISFIAALAMIITSLAAVTVSAAPDLTQDFVKTFKESNSTAQAADSLIRTKDAWGSYPAQPQAYMLRGGNDIQGRNSGDIESNADNDITLFDGTTGSAVNIIPGATGVSGSTNTVYGITVAGQENTASPTPRAWFDKSTLKDNDKIVVSVYVKASNSGKKTKFTLGILNNSQPAYDYNVFTDTYGREGMDVTDTWKKFSGVITIPTGFESASMSTKDWYTFQMGYPQNTTEAKINVSCIYAAKAKAVDIKTDIDSAVAAPGDTLNASAEILNQVGTTGGVSQDVTWYITDKTRANIITDGITVSADGKITVSDAAENGTYYAVAVANADETMVSGKAFQVKGGAINVSKDFVKTFKESNSTAQAADSLVKTKPGEDGAYMLRGGNDYNGRNSGFPETGGDMSLTYFDGGSGKSAIMLKHEKAESDTTNEANAVHGTSLITPESSGGIPRTWFDKSGLKPGDKLVVSIYAKTVEEGKITKFNLGLSKYNLPSATVFTDTYGKSGMEVNNEWKKFAGVITVPSDFTTTDVYTLHFGFAQNTKMEKMAVSCIYAATAKAVDINASLSKETAQPGDTLTASAEILNQIGTTAGVSQDVNWYVANEDRSEVLTDSGITVSEDGTVSIADSAEKGTYYIVAMSANNRKMLKGAKLLVEGKDCSINLTKTGNGSVSYEKTDGTSVTLSDGANTVEGGNSAFTFTPDEGYEITSIEFGGASIPISDKHGFSSILTIDGTKELKVTFSVRSPEAPSVSSEDPIFVANYDYTHLVQGAAPSNAILGYATLDLGYGNTISECGYILANESGKTVTLPAYVIPSGGGKYGIRAVGAALTAGVYKFTPYVKLADNTVIYGTEKTVTIS
ncbi:MAG: hypothetical protein SPL89_07900 [Clostridia bacterium]|nr:hypothetical protein [Clostridia bacterium]